MAERETNPMMGCASGCFGYVLGAILCIAGATYLTKDNTTGIILMVVGVAIFVWGYTDAHGKKQKQEAIMTASEPKPEPKEEMKKCPYCAESIKKDAIKCRFCGSDITDTEKIKESKP